MKITSIVLILSFTLFIFGDPLTEIVWSHDSKDYYLYIKAGGLMGFKAVAVFEVPLFLADPLIIFSGCDVNLIKAMIRSESGFKVHAKSKTGALGVSQIVRGTAKWLGLRNPYNPVWSSFAICKYVRYLYKKFPTTEKMLWAYHDGEGKIKLGGPSRAARNYANIVLKYYNEYQRTGRLEFFKDRVYAFLSADYFFGNDLEVKLGGALSILGTVDFEGGYMLDSEGFKSWFVRSYLRVFHDLALIVGWSEKGWELGSSTWLDDYNLEVLSTPDGPEATVYLNGLGIRFRKSRIGFFYRLGF